jgi:glycosyltransferase involved in cell wall biosynthesis
MLIAHVLTRLLRAGSEENTIATCLSQAEAGHDVVLIHGNESNSLQRERCGTAMQLIEIPDLVHPVNPRRDYRATLAMRNLFRKIRPLVVHTHQSKAGITGRIAARLAHVPVIVHGVHTLPFVNVGVAKKTIYLTAERAVAGFTNAFINVSEGTRQSCIEHAVGRPEQHFVAHSGFDVSRFQNATLPEDWRAIVGVSEDQRKPPVVLMLAALEERKRHVAFLEVFERILQRVPDARLLLAGEGPARAAVEAAIASRNLSASVKLLGFYPSPERLIALCDLTVLTSVREGLPRVFIQSLAGGKPVVTTHLHGISEIVQDGVNGLIVPGEDLRHAADAVARLLTEPRVLRQMQAEAKRTDVSSWGVDSMCSTVFEVYDRFMGGQTAAG